jgi:glycosyltransferase involved in cell wall biosynthesis
MKLSVITINYNNCDGLRKTIESVVSQTFTDFEYIIIDGGSTDGSVDVIKEYAGRIDYWVSERDRGCYHAMNKGVKVAQGEYVIFMNSGDSFYTNDVIDAFVKENPTEDVLCGDMFLSLGCVNYVPT